MPSSRGPSTSLTLRTASATPLPAYRFMSPSRSSTASCSPVDAPLGTAARPCAPLERTTSASTVGLPRLSRISRACTSMMVLMMSGFRVRPAKRTGNLAAAPERVNAARASGEVIEAAGVDRRAVEQKLRAGTGNDAADLRKPETAFTTEGIGVGSAECGRKGHEELIVLPAPRGENHRRLATTDRARGGRYREGGDIQLETHTRGRREMPRIGAESIAQIDHRRCTVRSQPLAGLEPRLRMHEGGPRPRR